jgi:UDPglucose 6-dehydrogenase
VEVVNDTQKKILFDKLLKHYNGNIANKTIAIWGLAFKPETDDIREAPALVLIENLIQAGCNVRAFDPEAMVETKRKLKETRGMEDVYFAEDMYDATLNTDALLIVTEWKEFRLPNWEVIKRSMKNPLIFDGRNIYESTDLKANGIEYYCIGK